MPDNLDAYNDDTVHDMWVDYDSFVNTGTPDVFEEIDLANELPSADITPFPNYILTNKHTINILHFNIILSALIAVKEFVELIYKLIK